MWSWTALDADSKLIVSYLVSNGRDGMTAIEFTDDLGSRLEDRVQLSTDGLGAYLEAVEGSFGGDVDYAMVIKDYGKLPGDDNERRYSPPVCTKVEKRRIEGDPDMKLANTSYVERHNLSMRMGNRKLHAADQRLQQEGGEARRHAVALLRPLQLLAHPQDASGHAGDGGGPGGHGARLRMDRGF